MNVDFDVGDVIHVFTVDKNDWTGIVKGITNNTIKISKVMPGAVGQSVIDLNIVIYIFIDKIVAYRIIKRAKYDY